VFVQVKRVEDAVERFEAPGVFACGLACHLQGAFVVRAHEDAGRTAIMVGVTDYAGVGDLFGGSVPVRFDFPVEPACGVPAFEGEVGFDDFRMGEDVGLFVQIYPHTVYTAGGFAIRPAAAANGFGVIEAGVKAQLGGQFFITNRLEAGIYGGLQIERRIEVRGASRDCSCGDYSMGIGNAYGDKCLLTNLFTS